MFSRKVTYFAFSANCPTTGICIFYKVMNHFPSLSSSASTDDVKYPVTGSKWLINSVPFISLFSIKEVKCNLIKLINNEHVVVQRWWSAVVQLPSSSVWHRREWWTWAWAQAPVLANEKPRCLAIVTSHINLPRKFKGKLTNGFLANVYSPVSQKEQIKAIKERKVCCML